MRNLAKLVVASLIILTLVISGMTLIKLGNTVKEFKDYTSKDLTQSAKTLVYIRDVKKDINNIYGGLIKSVRVDKVLVESANISYDAIDKLRNKPSYDYLKDVTVYITGEVLPKRTAYGSTVLGSAWSGTGTVIGQKRNHSYVLTNAHVAGKKRPGEKVIKIILEDREVEAMVFSYHEEFDLAILLVFDPLKEKKTIKGVNPEIRPSERAYSVGHYLGIKDIYTEGTFAGYYKDFYDFNLPVAFGCSGSGVFDSNGDMIAVVFAIHGIGYTGVDTAKAITVPGKVVKEYINWLGY